MFFNLPSCEIGVTQCDENIRSTYYVVGTRKTFGARRSSLFPGAVNGAGMKDRKRGLTLHHGKCCKRGKCQMLQEHVEGQGSPQRLWDQCISEVRVRASHLGFWQHCQVQRVRGWAQDSAFLARSLEVLQWLLCGPHSEQQRAQKNGPQLRPDCAEEACSGQGRRPWTWPRRAHSANHIFPCVSSRG